MLTVDLNGPLSPPPLQTSRQQNHLTYIIAEFYILRVYS